MVVGGLPEARADHLETVCRFALETMKAVESRSDGLRMRIGIETGSVVAGVIGTSKFSYDLWGDTVNTASRMESHGVPGRIQVTGRVRNFLGETSEFERRGSIDVKGKGAMETYFLVGVADESASSREWKPPEPA